MNFSLFYFIILFSLPSIAAYADLEADTELLLKKGLEFFEIEKFEKAILSFDEVLEIEPNHVNALLNKAKALLELGRTEEANSYFDMVLEIDPNHVDALNSKGGLLVQLGKLEQATSYFERIIEVEPNHIVALGYKGDELLRIGKPQEAIPYFERIFEIEPKHVDAFKVPYFDKVLEIDPNHVDALNAKGSSLVTLGRTEEGMTIIRVDKLDEAISYFDKALEIEPNNVDVLFNKGRALVQLSRVGTLEDGGTYIDFSKTEGMSYIEKVLEIEPYNIDAMVYKADQLVNIKKFEEATPYLDKVLEIEPNNIDALFNKGSIFGYTENYDEAMFYYDKILKINKKHRLAATNLEIGAIKLGNIPLDGFLEAIVHDSEGRIVMHNKIPKLSVLNHEIGKSFVDKWPVTKVITRNGENYEVLQYEASKKVHISNIYGGAQHYGIKHPQNGNVFKVYANYWQYLVQPGDTVTFIYTVFRPVA